MAPNDGEHCQYPCGTLGIPLSYRRWANVAKDKLEKEVVRLHRDMLDGKCPQLTTTANFRFNSVIAVNGDLKSGLIMYCKYVAAQAASYSHPGYMQEIVAWRDGMPVSTNNNNNGCSGRGCAGRGNSSD